MVFTKEDLYGLYQVFGEFARADGVVEAALVAVFQDEPCLQQVRPSVRSCMCASFLDLSSRAPMHPAWPPLDQASAPCCLSSHAALPPWKGKPSPQGKVLLGAIGQLVPSVL